MTVDDRHLLRRLLARARLDEAPSRGRGMPDLGILSPLLECLPAAPPPPGLLPQIEKHISALRRTRQRALPRFHIVGAGLLGAAVGAVAVLLLAPLPYTRDNIAPGAALRLEVIDGAERVAMLGARTIDNGAYLRIDHFGLRAPESRALELWLVRQSVGRPASLGLLASASGVTVVPLAHAIADGDVLAISEEPAGGAQKASPSGPVILTARVDTVF